MEYTSIMADKANAKSKKKSGSAAPQRLPLIQRFPASFLHNNVVQLATAEEQAIINQYGLTLERGIYYKGIPVYQNKPTFNKITDQEYFYRAMAMEEARSWLAGDGKINPQSGQPWASYLSYSKEYVTNKSNYNIILEINAPGFLNSMKTIDIIGGKPESKAQGDLSWGIGGQNKGNINSFGGTKQQDLRNPFNQEWISAAQEYQNIRNQNIRNQNIRNPNQLSKQNTQNYGAQFFQSSIDVFDHITPPEYSKDNAVALAPYLFKRAIQSVKVVYLRTTP